MMNLSISTIKIVVIGISSVLIGLTGCSSNQNKETESAAELKKIADAINTDFLKIRDEAKQLALYVQQLYTPEKRNKALQRANPSKYRLSEKGILYKPVDDGYSAVFVSGHIPVDNSIKEIVYFTEPLDQKFKEIIQQYPEVAQVYYNDKNSYNRIYPFFDVLTQYEPKMNIPDFNFYYLADAQYNPKKEAVWVDEPYVDPAGRGWMVSAIAPVYLNDALEGVPGLDVTVSTITNRYIAKTRHPYVILDANGIVVAMNESLTGILSLPKLEDHTYLKTIKEDTYRTENFNLLKSKSKIIRQAITRIYNKGEKKIMIQKDNVRITILAEEIPELNWRLLLVLKN